MSRKDTVKCYLCGIDMVEGIANEYTRRAYHPDGTVLTVWTRWLCDSCQEQYVGDDGMMLGKSERGNERPR